MTEIVNAAAEASPVDIQLAPLDQIDVAPENLRAAPGASHISSEGGAETSSAELEAFAEAA